MRAVFLDFASWVEDLDTSELHHCFDALQLHTPAPDQVIERMANAEVMLVNKVRINEQHFGITGAADFQSRRTDNVDKAAAVAWCHGV